MFDYISDRPKGSIWHQVDILCTNPQFIETKRCLLRLTFSEYDRKLTTVYVIGMCCLQEFSVQKDC